LELLSDTYGVRDLEIHGDVLAETAPAFPAIERLDVERPATEIDNFPQVRHVTVREGISEIGRNMPNLRELVYIDRLGNVETTVIRPSN